ncbi:MAG: hypothetical protein KGS09_01630 [Nitrospirae bacterium]|nr:hypothetical protein [Nitrospirota bacterium]MDE3039553.1 hypothetical protein [Nitrospirota bacterium]
MSLIKLVAQTTRRAPSTLTREMFIAPTMLPVCCVCGLIREETGFRAHHERWVTQRTYRRTHGVNPTDVPLTHTYCLKCFTKAREAMKQYFRDIGTSA